MYEAKQEGRNRLAVYTGERQARMQARLTWSERFRQALEDDRFELYCQPIVDCRPRTSSATSCCCECRATTAR